MPPRPRALARRLIARRPRLRLRTKVSLLFGFIALVAGVSVAVVTYSFARASLLDQRTGEARTIAVRNAGRVRDLLPSATDEELGTYVQGLPGQQEFVQIVRGPEVVLGFPLQFAAHEILPADLRASVAAGQAATQRFSYDGHPYLGVGIVVPAAGFSYFQAFPLDSTERTLRTILLTFTVGAAIAVALFGAAGIWTGRRLLRPLGRVTEAAEDIAAGDLHTRVAPQHDPDLAPLVTSFNDMAVAVQTRIERESRFVSDVSHEMRSPITALQAATDVLERRRDSFDDRSRQAVDVIIDQVRRFDQMVLDLLELSRLDAGAADLHLEVIDTAATCRRIAAHHGLADLPVEADPAAPTHAVVDRVRFERILGNLLQNAVVHADGPTDIRLEPAAAEGFVDIVVADRGAGVDPAERQAIFGRFARGRASRHRVGTGLGLALVAEHAQALGGEAWVEDNPGGGSRFVVRLPAPDPDDSGGTT